MTQQALKFKGKIDKLGRIVIPKKVREALHLQPESSIEISVEDGSLHIAPEAPRYVISKSAKGRPVIHMASAALVGNDPVAETPDERMDRLMQW